MSPLRAEALNGDDAGGGLRSSRAWDQLREASVHVAVAVAQAAAADAVAGAEVDDSIEQRIRAAVWEPGYRPIIGI